MNITIDLSRIYERKNSDPSRQGLQPLLAKDEVDPIEESAEKQSSQKKRARSGESFAELPPPSAVE